MHHEQLAQARSNTYSVFGRLFLEGLTADLQPYVQAIPELATRLEPGSGPQGISSGRRLLVSDSDAFAAEHYRLFGFEVFPFESMYLDAQALLGGSVTDSVLSFYQQVGFDAGSGMESADHVGLELAVMAFLCGAEADAWQDGLVTQAVRMRQLQCRFLDEHLSRWLPSLVYAIRQQGHLFFAALANLTMEMVLAHRSTLGGGRFMDLTRLLPPLPSALNGNDLGLRDIARYLTTPAYSGCFLSRGDIGRLARRHGLPRGFGGRQQMLSNLLRAAADYERLEPLLTDMQVWLDGWQTFYTEIEAFGGPVADTAGLWLERLASTQRFLVRLKAEMQEDNALTRVSAVANGVA